VKSHLLASFRKAYQQLPEDVRRDARKAYRQFRLDPNNPGLQFKKVLGKNGREYWSARVGLHYRVLAIMKQGEIFWFWIGSHSEYEGLLV
jgi:mRNA-degrading endonuclease RelE of RelBE toxin-antitoxin system